ncbi:MAG: hypothetical protein HWN68_09690 [Desulfobacterales bacterium]|nr:hypothetical protein [Desulfobacterales bacterium]
MPINELLAFMIALMLAAVGFGLVRGRKPEAALIMFTAGLFISAMAGLIGLYIPITLTVVLALMLGWRYARGD